MQEAHSSDPAPGRQGTSPPKSPACFPQALPIAQAPPGLRPSCRPTVHSSGINSTDTPHTHTQPPLPAKSPDSSLPLPPEPKYAPNHRQGTVWRLGDSEGIAPTRPLRSFCMGFLAEEEARGNTAWRGQSRDCLGTPGIARAPQGGSGAPALVSDTFGASPGDLAFWLPPSAPRAKVGWGPLPTLATSPLWRVQSPKGTRENKVLAVEVLPYRRCSGHQGPRTCSRRSFLRRQGREEASVHEGPNQQMDSRQIGRWTMGSVAASRMHDGWTGGWVDG